MTMTTITSMKFRIAFFFLFIGVLSEMRYYSSIFRQNVYLPPKKRRESSLVKVNATPVLH